MRFKMQKPQFSMRREVRGLLHCSKLSMLAVTEAKGRGQVARMHLSQRRMVLMRCHLIISHALWPNTATSADVTAGLSLPAFATLAGRGRRESFEALPTRDWLAQCFGLTDFPAASLTVAMHLPQEQHGYWLRVDPVHLTINQRGAEIADPASLAVTKSEAVQLIAALNAQLAEDGLRFVMASAESWLLFVSTKPDVTFLPLDSVYGCTVHDALPHGPEAARWHRLVNEIQMLLHGHAVNDARARAGQLLINSVWLWGGGQYPLPEKLPRPTGVVYCNDPLLNTLASLSGAYSGHRPVGLSEVTGKDVWVLLDELDLSAQWGDAQAWRHGWQVLERDWFRPARHMLQQGHMRELHITLPEAGITITVCRADLLRLWRRAWLPWQ